MVVTVMHGSYPGEFNFEAELSGLRLFSVSLPGGLRWGWQRVSGTGERLAHCENLFPDYVACICDARRHM